MNLFDHLIHAANAATSLAGALTVASMAYLVLTDGIGDER
jgi:hypothetical protein